MPRRLRASTRPTRAAALRLSSTHTSCVLRRLPRRGRARRGGRRWRHHVAGGTRCGCVSVCCGRGAAGGGRRRVRGVGGVGERERLLVGRKLGLGLDVLGQRHRARKAERHALRPTWCSSRSRRTPVRAGPCPADLLRGERRHAGDPVVWRDRAGPAERAAVFVGHDRHQVGLRRRARRSRTRPTSRWWRRAPWRAAPASAVCPDRAAAPPSSATKSVSASRSSGSDAFEVEVEAVVALGDGVVDDVLERRRAASRRRSAAVVEPGRRR